MSDKLFKCQVSLITSFGTFNTVPLEVTPKDFEQKKLKIQQWSAGDFDEKNHYTTFKPVPIIFLQLEDGSFLSANSALLQNAVVILKRL